MDAAVFREPRRRVVAVPGGEIAALEFGPEDRAIDIVFVHANGFNAQTYRTLLSPLAAGMRILAIDQRGHGASEGTSVSSGATRKAATCPASSTGRCATCPWPCVTTIRL